jgi:hypothetical protein
MVLLWFMPMSPPLYAAIVVSLKAKQKALAMEIGQLEAEHLALTGRTLEEPLQAGVPLE